MPSETEISNNATQQRAANQSAIRRARQPKGESRRQNLRGADLAAFAATAPGTLAGRYLRMFWQPVYPAEKLIKARPVPIQVMGEMFTLYRSASGVARLVGFRCPHRQTQLSLGAVEGENIRCFYHGWVFDGRGDCVQQPAEPKPFCHKVSIPSYPTREYLGLIFAYLGDGEPPPFPSFPSFEHPDAVLWVDPYVRECNFFQNLENSVDSTHVGFVHRTHTETFDGAVDSPRVLATESEWGVRYETTRPSGWHRVTQFGMPNQFHMIVFSPDPTPTKERAWQESLTWWVPIDDKRHMTYFVHRLPVSPREAADYKEQIKKRLAARTLDHVMLTRAILAGDMRLEDVDPLTTDIVRVQDAIAQAGQGEIVERSMDRLGQADVGVALIRRIWARELQAIADGRPLKKWFKPLHLVPVHEDGKKG